jgi:hypothetical protein
MNELLEELRLVLVNEGTHLDKLKLLKVRKDEILSKLEQYIDTDSYSTDYCTIKRDFSISGKNEEFSVSSSKLDKKAVVDYYELTGLPPLGVNIMPKLIVRRKINGISES